MGQDHNGVTDQKTAEGNAVIDIGDRSENLISVQRRNGPGPFGPFEPWTKWSK